MARSKKSQILEISLVGSGTLASALGPALRSSGLQVREILARDTAQSLRRARVLAKSVGANASSLSNAELSSQTLWICVPDDSIAEVSRELAARADWKGKIVLHSSGALSSQALVPFEKKGAATASVHPLMTFVRGSNPNLAGVPFALEGDGKAVKFARAIVRRLGGKPFAVVPELKPAYHAFGFFCSPGIATLIAAAQEAGRLAGFSDRRTLELMEPIVRQTIENCFGSNPAQSFSGPLRRGDAATVGKHLEVLKQRPELLDLYRALARVALSRLPIGNAEQIKKTLAERFSE